jgi:hypothetical protein
MFREVPQNPHFKRVTDGVRAVPATGASIIASVAQDSEHIDRTAVVAAFRALVVALSANDDLALDTSDMDWIVSLCDGPKPELKAVVNLMAAWWTAPQ